MYLVAIAWMFVVMLMAVVEATSPIGTVLGAVFTLLLYGLLPLSIVLYVMGTPARRAARRAAEAAGMPPASADGHAPARRSGIEPDGGPHAAGDAIAPVRKEP